MIPVTKPFLPDLEEYIEYVKGIWKRNWLTNNGPLVNEFELQLKDYLGLEHLLYVTNGTLAIQIAIKALGLTGEIITTPFSYVATTSSIFWEGCTPVFVDIDSDTLNIDPKKIEAAITKKTSAIVATHVFGNPCDVEALEAIAKDHNLKLIFDGAHSFGLNHKGKSVFLYGDISTTSFHATKLFHTIEGGAVFTKDPDLLKRMAFLRNFGHAGQEAFDGVGINGKNSEFHAAMGLCNLKNVDSIIEKRKSIAHYYDQKLRRLKISRPKIIDPDNYTYPYYPILIESEARLQLVKKELEKQQIFPRRYFYPVLTSLDYVNKTACPIAENTASRILCLPLHFHLSKEEVDYIARILLRIQNYS